MPADEDLDAFIDESIRRSVDAKHYPARFIEMRERFGTKATIERLVISGDIKSGFKKALSLGLIDWTLEAAVLKFPTLFGKYIRDAAKFRLDHAGTV